MEQLWNEYRLAFRDFDDLTLGRWLAQTLGQFEGKCWRLSHPLIGAYRLAAQAAYDRQVWLKRLATPPAAYPEAACCRAPLLPLLTREVHESGLICQHCGQTAVPFEELPEALQSLTQGWAAQYAPVHAVAHWDEEQRRKPGDYEEAWEAAAQQAERLLSRAGRELAPKFLEHFPTIIWEDQDECLEVQPEDIPF